MDDVTTIVPEVESDEPAPRSRTKRGGLFVTDAELIEKLNVPENIARPRLKMLDADKTLGFPQKSRFWGGRRYWPAVQAWLDRQNGLNLDAPHERRQSSVR